MKTKEIDLERLPPQNIEAEQAVLGAILLDNDAIQIAREIIEGDDFYKSSHRKIFEAMLELNAEEKGIDLITLSEKLRAKDEIETVGGASYLNMLSDVTPTAANTKYHSKIIKKKAVLRSLLRASHEIAVMVHEENEEASLLLNKSQALINEVVEKSDLGEEMEFLQTKEEDLLDYLQYFRETPFRKLNDLIGGFSARNLVVIGGRAGMGKTSFVLSLLRRVVFEDGLPVAYFGSSNHKDIDTSLRFISALARISFKDLKRGRLNGDDMKKVKEANEKINQARGLIQVKFGSNINVLSIPPMVRGLQKKVDRLGLIIIENLQDLAWPENLRTGKERIDNVLNALRVFENEIKIPIIVSSQINRTAEDEPDSRPRLSDLKGSGNIEDLADIVMLLHRSAYHDHNKSSEGLPEDGELIIAKGGPATIVPLKFYGDYLCWEDM